MRQQVRGALYGGMWVLLALSVALLAFLHSGFFAIEQVAVVGFSLGNEEELLARAQIHLGQNLFRLDPRSSQRMILTNPGIAKVQVTRVFPNGVEIQIQEREAALLVPLGDGFAAVDGSGVVFAILHDIRHLDVPIFTGLTSQPMIPGAEVESESIWTALQVILTLKERASEVAEVSVGESVTLLTTEGIRVQLGAGEQVAHRALALPPLLDDFQSKGWTVREVDLTSPTPLVRR